MRLLGGGEMELALAAGEAGVRTGSTRALKGLGMPRRRKAGAKPKAGAGAGAKAGAGAGAERGDLIITFAVVGE